ncbi:MAG: DNA methyltransferase [Methylobacter sp.]|nr:DNA methyltransferase [Methylobacter sp.]
MTNKSITADQQPTTNSQQIALLKKHFANCFDKHGSFIPDKLQEIVQTSGLSLSKESYSLNWLGKSYARLLANENIHTLLKADTVHNAKAPHATSQNLLIKGDNLEVLKHLMGAYSEQVKMIYIDPPYNTGSDGFVYQDDRKFTVEQLSSLAGIDEDEAKRILEFTSSSSNSHSAWLTFMYPRLYLAKQLLRDDGVIFISIDDNEQAQLKVLCDEVFGEENAVGSIVWKNVTDNNPSNIATEHESIIVYAKSKNSLEGVWKSSLSDTKDLLINIGNKFISKNSNQGDLQKEYSKWFRVNKFQLGVLDRYKYIDFGGVYTGSQSVHNPGKEGYRYDVFHPDTHKPCKEPLMGYRFPKSTMDDLLGEKKILFGEDHNKIIELKLYAKDYADKLSSIIELDGRLGANELRKLFPEVKTIFTNPKPTDLVEKLISFATGKSDFVFDFFAGSGTTAHAVMQLNAKDGGNRQFICVQIDEATAPKSEAYKAGYKTIFDITQTRISKVAAKIQAEHPDYQGNLGFKVFETIPMFDKYLDAPDELTENLDLFDIDTLSQDDRHNLLLTWTLRDGIKLGTPFAPVILGDYTVYAAGKTLYFVEPDISLDAVVALLGQLDNNPDFSPSRLVVLGYLLDSKVQREMTEAVKHYNNRKGIVLTLDIRYN